MYKVITPLKLSLKNDPEIESSLDKILQNKKIGFTQVPERGHLFESSQKIADELRNKYEQFLIIGIGGSSMGSRALAEISSTTNIHFLDNVDSFEFERLWNSLAQNPKYASPQQALSKTGFLVVSKSGSTIEILWNYSLLENLMSKLGLKLIEQTYFVTELTDNPLALLAKKHSRPVLEVPLDVGGRFSVLTPVGLVVAALCGFKLNDLRAGAAAALKDKTDITAACRYFLKSFARKEAISLFWFYNSNYRWFGAWLQQLWAESLGKKENINGAAAPDFSTPMTAVGACDQHSILQQVAHGTKNKLVSFYCFNQVEKSAYSLDEVSFDSLNFVKGRNYGSLIAEQARATMEALEQNQVSSDLFQINDSNSSYTLGYLFMYFQLIVATLGVHENINPFDQPGVALGKELTLKRLQKASIL